MDKKEIYKMLEEIEEPMLGVDIVNLSLVYEVCVKNEKDVEIVMTTRNEDCMLADYIALSAREHLAGQMGNLEHIDIKMVSAPKWTQDRMSKYAKYLLDL
ncbi:iron-sulfur cluster assembly protein [Mesobacillus subterraneus]|uniref:metal-sulfur cluster assembly factor n=1 Tax=Mesobacillus subterraneus TaxID=285983 RepID=UPI00273D8E9C|nr:iron-sulfur cluster assembly protein [Mesobacillus subterraneus]WLR53743.1 iron-sulfur cluster assembly protein [Mesobacillus subterraneus]